LLSLLGICLVIVGVPLLYREWQLRRHRHLHSLLFNAARDRPKLTRWFHEISRAFPEMVSLPELHDISFDRTDRVTAARAAITLAAERFGYPVRRIELVMDTHPELPNAAGAAEIPPRPWTWKLEEDRMHFVVDQPSPPTLHKIFIAEGALANDEKLAWLAAHEVAHLALAWARLTRTGREDEEITDLATIVAGYGPLLLRHRYVEERMFPSVGRVAWRITQFGTLSKPAVAFARELRSAAVAGPVQSSSEPAG
jgi:hypothetical protein